MGPTVVTQLVFVLTLAAQVYSAPISTNLDYSSTFQKFFRIKNLIDRINIKNFKGPQKSIAAVEPAITTEGALTEIDLTEEAIENDEVTPKIASDRIDFEEEPIGTVDGEEIAELTTEVVVEDIATEAVTEEAIGYAAVEEEITTEAAIAPEEEVATEAVIAPEEEATTEAAIAAEEEVAAETTTAAATKSAEEDESLNEIDVDQSPTTPKYGYKILLKKVHGNVVPVGKIKFTLPAIMVELDPETATTIAPAVEEEEVTEEDEVTDAPITEDEVTTEAIAVEVDEEVLTYNAETTSAAVEEVTTVAPTEIEEDIPDDSSENVEEDVQVDDSILEEVNPRVAYTVEEASAVEQTTYVPPFIVPEIKEPIIAEVPEIETIDQNTIAEGAMEVKANTELAVEEIRNLNQSSVLPMDSCEVSLDESEALLVGLATNIAESAPAIEEILEVGKSLKDEKDSAALSLGGARLLKLLEPFLESLVPPQVSSCADSSMSMVRTITGMAATLDTIAESSGVTETRAEGLHKAATSLQLAAWMMSQLQASVHTMYSGACTEGYSSTADIMAALGRVVEGYIPVVTVLGPENSVEELNDTVEALQRAADDIAAVEARSGSSLPGVECGSSFSEMGLALERLAAFLVASGEV